VIDGNITIRFKSHNFGSNPNQNVQFSVKTTTGWRSLVNYTYTFTDSIVYWDAYITYAYNLNLTGMSLNISNRNAYTSALLTDGQKVKSANLENNLTLALNSGACDCSGCIITSEYFCNVPYYFRFSTGQVEYSSIFVNYTTTTANLYIYIRDAKTKKIITTNMTVQVISPVNQLESTTITGYKNLTINLAQTTLTSTSIRVRSTNIDDYSMVIREVDIEQDGEYNYTIYVSNTSDTTKTKGVTFVVQNENRNRVEGAIISIFRQDSVTNTYLPITDLTTKSGGDAYTILETNNVFYSWVVYLDDAIIYGLPKPVTISPDQNTIVIVGATDVIYSAMLVLYSQLYVNSSYEKISNIQGYFKSTYTALDTYYVQFRVYNVTGGNKTLVQTQTYTGTSGYFQTNPIQSLTTTMYYYEIWMSKDGSTYFHYQTLPQYIGTPTSYIEDSKEGLFLLLILVIIAAFGFLAGEAIVALVFLTVSVIMLALTKVVPEFTMVAAIGIASLVVVSMFTLVRKRKYA